MTVVILKDPLFAIMTVVILKDLLFAMLSSKEGFYIFN